MIPRYSSEERGKLARDIATNLVFTSDMIRDTNLVSMIFMPIALGAFADMPKEDVEDVGMIYEYMDKAGPRGVNGYPIFWSCHILGKKDTKIVIEMVQKILKSIEEATK